MSRDSAVLWPTLSDAEFRMQVREFLRDSLSGPWSHLRGQGGPGREHESYLERVAWDRYLAANGWSCIGWPVEYGGRGLSLWQQVIFHEEYALSDAPSRVSHLGEQLLGPTLIAFGTPEQKARFLPPIAAVEELWCQGYSEPGAGSDLANVSTKARLDEAAGEWVIDGQKVWTSWAHEADWCFVVARTEPGSRRHRGLSYLLVPMDQPGVEIRPILQLTGTSEFNEVFFSDARTGGDLVVGDPGQGWGVAMATLSFERGVSTLGEQVGFRKELNSLIATAKERGTWDDPVLRDRLVQADVDLEVLGLNSLRMLTESTTDAGQASITKLLWATWHRRLGELAMQVQGPDSLVCGPDYDLDDWQRLFLFSRADTIYGGSNEIQRNILAERVLGLPREARPDA